MKHSFYLADEQATTELAAKLAILCSTATVIYLEGDLGAGKTSFCRGFIHGLGYVGRVKSPTYTLVEPYEINGWRIFHFDLYRLSDPEELEYIGIRDYFDDDCICLIEWPDKGYGLLAAADLHISIEFIDDSRSITVQANNEYGQKLLSDLAQK
ncbi:tRNA (adenosine(37)-N6)-threonylcarbamoyltransferase complex ATPase subunit type 1 TsaE [Paraglaciecola sp. 20A4]|uniref:tRNA (adenosine(37)-N6)-threonylcarbamoyltransferase complex ATPase subunit type 1 TsaE n=1 Tax=Paraglaciecola sp. 20A4 TaxID=2687288 RepID=UPI00140BC00D|nr:tRNA (adenosine(37)-N6)-threonylcarbamoyltransferase complex ATPase subunit type 1 TsaE [Paraglaciecola sp. 20A4]